MVKFNPLELSGQDQEYLKIQAQIRDDIIKAFMIPADYFKFPIIPYEGSRKVVNPLHVYGSPGQDD